MNCSIISWREGTGQDKRARHTWQWVILRSSCHIDLFWKAQWFAEGFAIVVFEVILSWMYILSYKIIQFPRAIISSYIRWMICGMMFGVDSHNLRTINSRFHIDPPAPKAMCLLDIDCCFKRAEIKWQVLVRPPSGKEGHQKSPSPPAHLSFLSPSLPRSRTLGQFSSTKCYEYLASSGLQALSFLCFPQIFLRPLDAAETGLDQGGMCWLSHQDGSLPPS